MNAKLTVEPRKVRQSFMDFDIALDLDHLDATHRFGIEPDPSLPDHLPGCKCGQVMAGMVEPEECALFARSCSPDSPRGPCMVSFEGTCRNRFLFREA